MPPSTPAFTGSFAAPFGTLQLAVDAAGNLLRLDLPGPRRALPDERPDPARCAHVVAQLAEYFAGTRRDFTLPLAPRGTPFQLAAWAALRTIPFGTTTSYQDQARRLGRPTATRAVGAANGRNPLPIVVPCHRVIGKDGSLVGFGGGLPCKLWLLQHEAAVLARTPQDTAR